MIFYDDEIIYFVKESKLIHYKLKVNHASHEDANLMEQDKLNIMEKETELEDLFVSQQSEKMQVIERNTAEKYLDQIDEYDYESDITSITKIEYKLAIGLINGELFFDKQKVLSLDFAITALHYNAPFFVIGSASGQIQIYSQGKLCFEHWHISPINQVAFIDKLYLHDKSNRLIIIEPEINNITGNNPLELTQSKNVTNTQKTKQEQYDNLNMPFKLFNQYFFIADNNILYAKTVNNFSSIIELNNQIVDFCFNTNGGILFLLEATRIKIINFYNYELIREIMVFNCENGKIFYANNILFYSNYELNLIKNILSDEEQNIKPKKILLEENRFYISKSKELPESDSEDKELLDLFTTKPRKRKIYDYSDELDEIYKEVSVEDKNKKFNEKNNENDYYMSDLNKKTEYKELYNPEIIQEEDVRLLCYNEYGFLICKQDVSINLMELVYHDSSIPSKIIHCKNMSDKGAFDNIGMLISTDTLISYYENEKKWEKDISEFPDLHGKKIKFLRLCNYLYIIVETIYSYESLIILYRNSRLKCIIDLPPVSMFQVKNNILLILSRCILHVYDKEEYKRIETCGKVNFITVDTNKSIYYANEQFLYKIDNRLSKRILKCANKHILCLLNKNLIILNKLLPVPDVEYLKVDDINEYDEDIEFKSITENVQKSYERFENVPKKVRKYNPLQKK